jgi:urease accessory protein
MAVKIFKTTSPGKPETGTVPTEISPVDVGMRTAHTSTPIHLVQETLFPSSGRLPEEQVVIAAERRQFLKRRWRGVAADGTEFGFDLESRLADGCVVFQTDEKDYIVRQLPEPVYELPLESPAHAALVAWKVGNLHLPAQILDHAIRVLHDDAMTQLIEREAWPHSTPEVIFTPMKIMAHS